MSGHLVSAVTRLGVSEDQQLTAIAVHGPSMVEVPGVVVAGSVLGCFGLWRSVLRGNLRRPDMELLQYTHPGFLWISAEGLAKELRSAATTDDACDGLLAAILRQHRWPPGADKLQQAAQLDRRAVHGFLSGTSVPAPKNEKTTALLWFCRPAGAPLRFWLGNLFAFSASPPHLVLCLPQRWRAPGW